MNPAFDDRAALPDLPDLPDLPALGRWVAGALSPAADAERVVSPEAPVPSVATPDASGASARIVEPPAPLPEARGPGAKGSPPPGARALPRFPQKSGLHPELRKEVDAYFKGANLDSRGGVRMCLKTLTIFLWTGLSFGLLVFWSSAWWQAVPLAVSLGLAIACIGFSVMHDGGHKSYGGRRLNRLSAAALDLLGGSSYVWNFKHNVLHHTYTNIEGADDDIEFQPFLRLSQHQPRYWFHRFQFLYWPVLLCFLTTKWIFVDDYLALAKGQVAGHTMPRPRGWDLALFFGGKLAFVLWAIVLPLLYVPLVPYLMGFALVSMVSGLTLGTVFQLAHAAEDASFYAPLDGEGAPLPWAEHQIATTVDFARGNPLLTWYVGGLNHQVEHHLFPRVGHRHYPALAEIVRSVCARHGITPHDHRTFTGALRAHVRHLYTLGKRVPATTPA